MVKVFRHVAAIARQQRVLAGTARRLPEQQRLQGRPQRQRRQPPATTPSTTAQPRQRQQQQHRRRQAPASSCGSFVRMP